MYYIEYNLSFSILCQASYVWIMRKKFGTDNIKIGRNLVGQWYQNFHGVPLGEKRVNEPCVASVFWLDVTKVRYLLFSYWHLFYLSLCRMKIQRGFLFYLEQGYLRFEYLDNSYHIGPAYRTFWELFTTLKTSAERNNTSECDLCLNINVTYHMWPHSSITQSTWLSMQILHVSSSSRVSFSVGRG